MLRNSFFMISWAWMGAALVAGCSGEDERSRKDAAPLGDSSFEADTNTTDAAGETAGGCALGATCDDGDPCTEGDRCDAGGVCAGTAKTCDDGLACTRDSCVAATGACRHEQLAGYCLSGGVCLRPDEIHPENSCKVCRLVNGADTLVTLGDGGACNDGDACTVGDQCLGGVCQTGTEALACVSDDVCVKLHCEPATGCVGTATDAACDDGDPCTLNDRCAEQTCGGGGDMLECDDGDPCTRDYCKPGVGCEFVAKCDDGNACTNDRCDPDGTCHNEAFVGACDDGEPCTVGEVCDAAGVCGGGAARDCDDDNACTIDSCVTGQGCLNRFRVEDCGPGGCGPAACDDGATCTVNDRCVAGQCFGAKTAACEPCSVEGTSEARRLNSLEVMGDGKIGSGVDVDSDPTTCSPAGSCAGGIDNALSLLAPLVNQGIAEAVTSGTVQWLVDLRAARADGVPFFMPIYDSALVDPWCNFAFQTCAYRVSQLSLDAQCAPYFAFDNAVIQDGVLEAGGPTTVINMVLPLAGGEVLGLTIAKARVEANVVLNGAGEVTGFEGVIGGAVPKAQLIEAVANLSPDAFSLPGLDPAAAAALLDGAVTADIDLDGDGVKEAASVGLRVTTGPAVIVDSE